MAQEEDMFLSNFLLEDELVKNDVSDKYLTTDFSDLWTQTANHRIVGIIGVKHQRIRMALTSATQNSQEPFEYSVVGKSNVKHNICDFKGTIRIDSILEINQLHYGVDSMYRDNLIVAQGIIFATYEFRESQEQNHSGVFNGKLMTKWYLNSLGKLKYDNIQSISDGYMNNAFVGTWREYESETMKVCNWSDNRVPYSANDFDVGAGEFSPSKKYLKFGWEQYQRAWLYGDEEARKNELAKWWE